jgi:hypothetical protein
MKEGHFNMSEPDEEQPTATTKKKRERIDKHHTGNAATRKEIQTRVRDLPSFKGLRKLQRCFLTAYSGTFDVQKSAEIVGCHWRNHYVWLANNPAYKQAYEAAREIAGDVLESAVYDAVMNGDNKVLSFKGKVVDTYKQKSDLLRIFMLKGLKPEYRDSYNFSSTIGPVAINIRYPSTFPENSLTNQRDLVDAQVIKDDTAQHFLRPEPKDDLPAITSTELIPPEDC